MPWDTVDVKKVGKVTFTGTVANVQREASAEFAAHLDASRFPILFAEEPPAITNTTEAK
jgi:hypothetical protein